MIRSTALLLIVLILVSQGAPVLPVVKIVRAPSVVFDDESITIQVRVEPRPENRLLIVGAWEGETSIRTSLEQLDGDTAPRTRWLRWQKLTACDCELRAYVFTQKGQAGMDRRPLLVQARWQ